MGKIVIPEGHVLSDRACVAIFDCDLEIMVLHNDEYLQPVYADKVGIRRRHAIAGILKQ